MHVLHFIITFVCIILRKCMRLEFVLRLITNYIRYLLIIIFRRIDQGLATKISNYVFLYIDSWTIKINRPAFDLQKSKDRQSRTNFSV